MTDEEANQLIMLPGFSTAEKITDVSGRGVGMDVVKRNVEALNGSISISSTQGKGSCFRIRLPLTMAILDGLAMRLGNDVYVLPLLSVVESLRPEPKHIVHIAERGELVMVRGEPLPLIYTHRLFNVTGEPTNPCDGLVVIVEHQGRKYGIVVDELIGQLQVVMKSLEANLRAGGRSLRRHDFGRRPHRDDRRHSRPRPARVLKLRPFQVSLKEPYPCQMIAPPTAWPLLPTMASSSRSHCRTRNTALNILKVQEIKGFSKITPIPNAPPLFVRGVMNLRGTVVPIIDLRARFSMTEKEYDQFTCIVVVNVGSRVVGLVVDTVSDVLNIPTDVDRRSAGTGDRAATPRASPAWAS